MRLDDFDYDLPRELIAQEPCAVRDESRLMVVEREGGAIRHRRFGDLPRLLSPEDLLVLNDSRVLPARLYARRPQGTGQVEILLLREVEPDVWEALAKPGRKARPGQQLVFSAGRLQAEVVPGGAGAVRRLRFDYQGDFRRLLDELGEPPLPPYIQRPEGTSRRDLRRYQTVYARQPGSVAAPTAGLHFTPRLLERLRHATITLHVGYGTFQPVASEDPREHRMHPEFYHVSGEAAETIEAQRRRPPGRIVCVGSTATRVLEHLMSRHGRIVGGSGETDLFIYPGYRFQACQAMITNFHLPRSTLLLLVAAFAGKGLIDKAYQEAIRAGYRFYSYGDAMLIL